MFGQKTRGVLLIAVLAVASSHAAFAAEFRPEKEPEWKRRMRKKLKRRVTCEFAKAPLEDVISVYQHQTGVAITIEASVRALQQRRLTFRFEKAPLSKLLEVLAKQVGFDYVLRENGVFISTYEEIGEEGEVRGKPGWMRGIRRELDRRGSFGYMGRSLSRAIQFLRTRCKCTVVLDPRAVELRGDVRVNTLRATAMTLRQALDRFLGPADLDYAIMDKAIFISTRERLAGEFERRAAIARAEAASRGEKEPAWEKELRRKLAREVTFEFVDALAKGAIQYLQALTRTTFILDPKAVEGREATEISLRVKDMPLRFALRWILKLAGLDYTLKDEAIWISTPENVLAEIRRRAKPEPKKPGAGGVRKD